MHTLKNKFAHLNHHIYLPYEQNFLKYQTIQKDKKKESNTERLSVCDHTHNKIENQKFKVEKKPKHYTLLKKPKRKQYNRPLNANKTVI